ESERASFFFKAEDGIRDWSVTGVQTCALPICRPAGRVPSLRLPATPTILRAHPVALGKLHWKYFVIQMDCNRAAIDWQGVAVGVDRKEVGVGEEGGVGGAGQDEDKKMEG